jgi:hypothetical protein
MGWVECLKSRSAGLTTYGFNIQLGRIGIKSSPPVFLVCKPRTCAQGLILSLLFCAPSERGSNEGLQESICRCYSTRAADCGGATVLRGGCESRREDV